MAVLCSVLCNSGKPQLTALLASSLMSCLLTPLTRTRKCPNKAIYLNPNENFLLRQWQLGHQARRSRWSQERDFDVCERAELPRAPVPVQWASQHRQGTLTSGGRRGAFHKSTDETLSLSLQVRTGGSEVQFCM